MGQLFGGLGSPKFSEIFGEKRALQHGRLWDPSGRQRGGSTSTRLEVVQRQRGPQCAIGRGRPQACRREEGGRSRDKWLNPMQYAFGNMTFYILSSRHVWL